jgi:glycosyltransferase involved in cell wall biosynthesis
MKSMKIHFLLTQDLESPSGLGRYWPMARALSTRGHQVRISTLHPKYASLNTKVFHKDKVLVEYVAPMHVMKEGSLKKYYSPLRLAWVSFTATFFLIKAAFSTSVDIIYVCKPHPMNSIAGYLASRITGAILWVDCDDFEAGSNRFANLWQQRVIAFFEKQVPRRATLVTTNTNFMRAKLIEWGCPTEKIKYLPNGIDRERFFTPDPIDVARLRTELNLEGKRVLLYVGTMSLANHPVDLLISSFIHVNQKFSKTVLLLVGGGDDYQRLIDQSINLGISQVVRFIGRVSPEKVIFYYALAEVSIDPVCDDDVARGRSPLKLFESWACGVPFVTGPVGDRPTLLGNPPAGMMAKEPGDPLALANEINEVLGSPELANELRRRGLERIEQYTWDHLISTLENAYAKTAG